MQERIKETVIVDRVRRRLEAEAGVPLPEGRAPVGRRSDGTQRQHVFDLVAENRSLIGEIRSRKLMHPFLIEKIERLNKRHIPFVNLRNFDYPYGINEHSYKNGVQPDSLIEDEAKETLGLVFKVLFTDLSPR